MTWNTSVATFGSRGVAASGASPYWPDGQVGPVSQRLRQKEATRRALRAAAVRLFVDQGFHETTVEEISAAVGVTKRTFFLHFASKDEVLLGHVAEQLDLLRAALASAPPHRDAFARAGLAVSALAGEMQARDDLLLQLDLLHRVPALLAVSLEQFTAFEDAIADAVRRWRREVTRRAPTKSDDAYAHLVGTVGIAALRAGLHLWRRDGGNASLADLVAQQVDVIAAGMRPR